MIIAVDGLAGNLSVNPIQEVVQRLGRTAIYFLTGSLLISPMDLILNWKASLYLRRAFGLYAFLYAALHFAVFLVIDYGLVWALILEVILQKPFALVGFIAGLFLMLLAVTSIQQLKTILGNNWSHLHKLSYVAGLLAVLHYAWAKKGSLSTLSGDIYQPLLLGILILLALLARFPFIKKSLIRWKS